MTQSDVLVLLVAMPGRLRDGWRALLAASPLIGDVCQADDMPSGLEIIKAYSPALVMVDLDRFGEEAWTLLRQIKDARPRCHCIALARNTRQWQQAKAVGADATLLQGFSAGMLSATIEHLLEIEEPS